MLEIREGQFLRFGGNVVGQVHKSNGPGYTFAT
jgi:hypothetical protein